MTTHPAETFPSAPAPDWPSLLQSAPDPLVRAERVGSLIACAELMEERLAALARAATLFIPEEPFEKVASVAQARLGTVLGEANAALAYWRNRRLSLLRQTATCRHCGDETLNGATECRSCSDDHYREDTPLFTDSDFDVEPEDVA